jgi:hypothetical protein
MDILDIGWISVLRTINQILTAGVAITAVSIFLYTLAFNMQDRVARSFALILTCFTVIFTAEAIAAVSGNVPIVEFWLRLKWFGIVFLPATYLHFSDALLILTGHPSRGRRRFVVGLVYGFSFLLLALIPTQSLVGDLSANTLPIPYLERTKLTNLFTFYYMTVMLVAGYDLARAVYRAVTKTSRRRLSYLFVGAAGPVLASMTFLLHGIPFFVDHPTTFLLISIFSATVVGFSLVLLAYSVAFFGVTWTDRVIKSRLFKWIMRGPFVAASVLGLTTIIRRIGEYYGQSYSAYVPITMVGSILLLEYLITLLAPFWEKWLFYGADRDDLSLIRSLEDHLLTRKDLDQFLEIIVASICDRIQVPGACIAVFNGENVDYFITVGDSKVMNAIQQPDAILEVTGSKPAHAEDSFFRWKGYLIMPLTYQSDQNGKILLGICGFPWPEGEEVDEEHLIAVTLLGERAALALKDRRLQQQVLNSLGELQPQVNYIQKLRAVSGYDQTGVLDEEIDLPLEDFTVIVKDALVHYWGGPRFTESPLMKLRIVQDALAAHDGNASNALRSVLKNAIEKMKPEGEKRLTGEWILYNLLEMKFLEGKKVREIATKLAMSEADLYRKQRIALEAVAKVIMDMEASYQEMNDRDR